MTADQYRACLKAFGLTPAKPSFNGATIHQDSGKQMHRIIDPEELTESERDDFIVLLKERMGITDN